MSERLRRLRAPRTLRPVAVPAWDPKGDAGSATGIRGTAWRIEWQDGSPTDTGLFIDPEWAQRYAEGRGWQLDIEHEEDECA
jgi:hypothetical protein